MIIDVMNLNLETLNFCTNYDPERYDRGEKLYNNEKVQIDKAEVNDNNEYEIVATVGGNYDYYNTKLVISNNIIKKFSCTCVDYYKGNICKHIIATSMECLKPHNASTTEGREKLQQERQEELQRLRIKRQKEYEYNWKYSDGIKILEKYKQNSKMKTSNILDLSEIYEESIKYKNQKSKKLANEIKLEYSLEIMNKETLKLSFKIGQTRMYILNNISSFYQAYKNNETIYYGKQLEFIPNRENFTESSRQMFDLIIEYAEMIDYNNSYSNYEYDNYFNKAIFLTGKKINEFFDMISSTITLHVFDEFVQYELSEQKLDVKCILEKKKISFSRFGYWNYDDYISEHETEASDEYVLSLNIAPDYVLFSNDRIYVFYENKIYTLDKEKKMEQLFEIFQNKSEIILPEDKLEEFQKFVFPNISYIETKNLPEEISKKGMLVNKLASKILLDVDNKGNILLELKFCYMNKEFNILEKGYKAYVKEQNIVRNIPLESEIIKRLFMDGFQIISERKEFIMKDPDDIYEFLQNKINGYMTDFEVLATDKFKNKQIKQPKISNIGIRIDNGLLQLDISKINIDLSEIKDILKDYSIKKKYHKLKSGDFLDLTNNEDLNLLEEIETTLDIDYSKIENGVANLPINRSFYLEKILNSKNDVNIIKNKNFTDLVDSIGDSAILNKTEIDEEFEEKLRDYQKIGYKWLKTLSIYKFGGILADDMGLGKTLQVIAVLKSELKFENKTTSIVVCPSTLVLNWKAEIEKWCTSMETLIINGTATERLEKLECYEKYDLVITSYDLLKRDIDYYENKKFRYIIVDEAQYIKNASTQNAIAVKSLQGEIKFALTGTPIENSIAELWSIFDFIMPGYLYNYNKFKKKFEEPILKFEDKQALERLKKLISPFILRRVKKDVLTELPEKNITIMKNEMEDEQQKIYLSYLVQTRKEVEEELRDSSFEKSKFKILMLLTRLRQICCHPSLFIENYKGDSGKMKQCLDLVIDAIESEHKILLFSSYTSMFEIIEKEFDKLGIKYFKLIGDTPVNERVEMVDEFNNNDDIKVFLLSLKAGGTGLNLTSADIVIHYDPWWNVSSENQATDRAYRIGQKNSVQVYKLITNNSIEEKINKMQERKEKLSKDILSTEETFISQMSKKEILDLFE